MNIYCTLLGKWLQILSFSVWEQGWLTPRRNNIWFITVKHIIVGCNWEELFSPFKLYVRGAALNHLPYLKRNWCLIYYLASAHTISIKQSTSEKSLFLPFNCFSMPIISSNVVKIFYSSHNLRFKWTALQEKKKKFKLSLSERAQWSRWKVTRRVNQTSVWGTDCLVGWDHHPSTCNRCSGSPAGMRQCSGSSFPLSEWFEFSSTSANTSSSDCNPATLSQHGF